MELRKYLQFFLHRQRKEIQISKKALMEHDDFADCDIDLMSFLGLVALGTVCDVVPYPARLGADQ